MCYSDLDSTRYDIIGKVLDTINLDRNLLLSIGDKKAPFGITVNFKDDETLNTLLNSCKYGFVMTDKIEETNYILQTVLAGIIPICNMNHIFLKKLGLESMGTNNDFHNLIDKLGYIKYHNKIFERKISLLSWKYRNNYKKWRKN
jgi:hypothetical protein